MLADFSIRLAGGLSALILLTSWRHVPLAFFRTHCLIILAMSVLAGLDLSRTEGITPAFWGAVGMAMSGYVGAVCWGVGLPRIGRRCAWLSTAFAFAILVLQPSGASAAPVADGLGRLSSAFLMGASLTAMLLGHYYLTAPSMSIEPLKQLVSWTRLGLVVRILLALAALVSWRVGLVEANGDGRPSVAFLGMRWGMGFLFGAIATELARRTVLIRSTQSATGILYIAVTLIFLGELTSLILSRQTGICF